MKLSKAGLLASGVALAMTSMAAGAVEWHGYVRSGAGGTMAGGDQACVQADGAWTKWRLGNECENYAEMIFEQVLHEGENGETFKLHTNMAYVVNAHGDWEQFQPSFRENFVEVSGVLGGATVWAGKRFYSRHDIHMTDFYYLDVSGPGAGIQGIDLGFGSLSYAYIRQADGDGNGTTTHQFNLAGIETNPGGNLEISLGLGSDDNRLGENEDDMGMALGLIHFQGGVLGGFNKATLQYTNSNAAGAGRAGGKTDDYSLVRFTDMLIFAPNENVSGGAAFVYQVVDDGNTETTWMTIGARPQYHFDNYKSIAVELGYDMVSADTGGNEVDNSLLKLTVAPQISAGKSFWARPALRAFVTYFSWDDDQNRDLGTAFDNEDSGVAYGVQLEAWW